MVGCNLKDIERMSSPKTKQPVSDTNINSVSSAAWYDQLPKSRLTPPDLVFMLVWPVLYILMFVAMLMAPYDQIRWVFFMIQLCLNASWPYVFFRTRRLNLALVIILALIAINSWIAVSFMPSWFSFFCYLPYVVWLCFACYLLAVIVIQL